MHDLHLANQIVKIARAHAAKNRICKISKIVIELGNVIEHNEGVKPKNLAYNINLLLPCEIRVKRIKGDSWKLVSIMGT